ncbi:putative membrane protein [Arcanobacterium pluranimalium]|uniref:YhgE/Pip domain-containing protein n=1 Tax=Arcanobacterium pluranimalium TaxID=108028 RepID=UPI001958EF57|nr:YhgE/Pip domain-containing protein [Arcanobacterium pluranimalium]MBM7825248.1 putative membrane protein [Arcanobacterium pluranimalium]
MFAWNTHGTELKRFFRLPLTRAAILAILLIPLLYGAMYVWAFWDPTERLSDLPIALVNDDVAVTTTEGESVHIGSDVVDHLKEEQPLDITVTNDEDAKSGIESGKYYFMMKIPKDFSSSIVSLGTQNPEQAKIDVVYNDANSLLGSILGQNAMKELRTHLTATVNEEVSSKMLNGLSQAHDGLNQAHDGAAQLSDGVTQLNSGNNQLAEGAQTLNSGAARLATGASQLALGASQLKTGLDKAHAGSAEIVTGTNKVAGGASLLAQGSQQLTAGISTANDGSAALHNGTTQLLGKVKMLADGTKQLYYGVHGVPGDSSNPGLQPSLTQANAGAQKLAAGAKTLADGLSAMQTNSLDTLIAALENGDPLTKQIAEAKFRAAIAQTTQGAQQLSDGLNGTAQTPGLAPSLAAMSSAVDSKLVPGVDQLYAGTNSTTSENLVTAVTKLDAGAGSLNTGLAKLLGGAQTFGQKLSELSSGAQALNQGSVELNTGLGKLSTGAQKAEDATGQLAQGSEKLRDGSQILADGATQLADGSKRAADGAGELANKLAEGAAKIPAASSDLVKVQASTISQPIALENHNNNPADSWGEGFAPFFMSLALWVGSLITWLLLRPLPSRLMLTSAPSWRIVASVLQPAAAILTGQVLIMLGVMHWAVGVNYTHALGTIAFSMLIGITFLTMQHAIQAVFGAAPGKLIAIVLLMLQLASAGGTYPVDVTPRFFQVVHPWMPMTYAVDGLRETITGGVETRLGVAIVVLGSVTLASVVISNIATTRRRVWNVNTLHPALSI